MNAKTTRREFVSAGLAGAAATVASPWLVPASAFGANDRIVIGGIGVGNQGSGNMRGLKNSCSIAAIADVYLPRAEAFAKSVGAKHVYQDYRKLLEHDDIDAVVVCTPHHWHALCCIHAAQAGKDIFCEKPLSNSILEGRRIVEAHAYFSFASASRNAYTSASASAKRSRTGLPASAARSVPPRQATGASSRSP